MYHLICVMTLKPIVFWLIWCAFLLYSFLLAPKHDGSSSRPTGAYVKQLMFGPWHGINQYVIALFHLLGSIN
jgi:hypothetical protein